MKQIRDAQEQIALDFKVREQILKNQKQAHLFNKIIDATLLKPETTAKQIEILCDEAIEYSFSSICVPPTYVQMAAKKLMRSQTAVCTVVGFPLGYNNSDIKAHEIKIALENGVQEIDFVQNICLVKNQQFKELTDEVEYLVRTAKTALTKIILETSLLTADEIYICTQIAAKCGVNIIKTSTGFSSYGARIEDISVIRKAIDEINPFLDRQIGIKASGGIKSFAAAMDCVLAGATRIGTSSGVQIISAK